MQHPQLGPEALCSVILNIESWASQGANITCHFQAFYIVGPKIVFVPLTAVSRGSDCVSSEGSFGSIGRNSTTPCVVRPGVT